MPGRFDRKLNGVPRIDEANILKSIQENNPLAENVNYKRAFIP
jgi:hypothetical protein